MQVAQAYEVGGRGRALGADRGAVLRRPLEDLQRGARGHAAAHAAQGLHRSIPTRSGRRWHAGADAVLLIVAALDDAELATLAPDGAGGGARRAGRGARPGRAGARARRRAPRIIGVNNRDLRTMEVGLETSLELAPLHPGRRRGGGGERHPRTGRHPAAARGGLRRVPRRRAPDAGADPSAALETLIRDSSTPPLGRPRGAQGRRGGGQDLRDHHRRGRASRPPAAGADAIGFVFCAGQPALRRRGDRARDLRAPCRRSCCAWACSWTRRRPRSARDRRRGRRSTWCSSTATRRRSAGRAAGAARSRRCRVDAGLRPPRTRCASRARRPASCSTRAATPGGATGGTGRTFDWSLAREVRERASFLVLAGGLTPENVGAALTAVRPDAVDVSSGVESSPGRKDPAKVRAFVDAVRSAAMNGPERPDDGGRFGPYGGRYVPETLMEPLRELEDGLRRGAPRTRRSGASWLALLRDYVGRPTPLTRADRLSERLGCARLPEARGPVPHRRAQDQQRARPGAAGEAHGQAARRRRDGRGPARRRHRHRLRAARPRVRRLHGHARTCARQAPNVLRMRLLGAEVRARRLGRAHAEGRDQRGHARLGHERAHDALPARLGAGRAPVSDDGARLPGRDRRRGARADPGARRARCRTCWWPASAAARTRSGSSTPSWTTRWRWSASRRAAARPTPGEHAARFLGEGGRGGRRAARHAHVPAAGRRGQRAAHALRSRPASTIRRSGPSTRCCTTRAACATTRVRDDGGAGRVPTCCARRRASSPRSSRRTPSPGSRAKRAALRGTRVLVNLSGRGDKDLAALEGRARDAASATRFARLAGGDGRKAFVGFVTAGDPSLDRTVEIALRPGGGRRRRAGAGRALLGSAGGRAR